MGVVWYRLDLRTADHPALVRACRECEVVLPVFLMHEHRMGHPLTAALRAQLLLESVSALQQNLSRLGGELLLRRIPVSADPLAHYQRAVCDFLVEVNADALYLTPQVEPGFIAQDRIVADWCALHGVAVYAEESVTSLPLLMLTAPSGDPYKVYTPFGRHHRAQWTRAVPTPLAAPSLPPESASVLATIRTEPIPSLADLGIATPSAVTTQRGGEGVAQRQLAAFLDDGVAGYGAGRDFLDRDVTSHLSHHLHLGTISAREVIWRARVAQSEPGASDGDIEKFIQEVIWRDFGHAILFHFPNTVREAFQARHRNIRWNVDSAALEAWKTGMTGYPVIDAAMRELLATGSMHNRMRMLVASFLTKDLGLHWRLGADHFMAHLIDGNLANNTLGWQWTAGIGVDAAPYFRIFNPVTQSQKFDPAGEYIRQWVPELGHLATRDIHDPARQPAGLPYPAPIIDRAAQRKIILARYKSEPVG